MECLYVPELEEELQALKLQGAEFQHLKALRLHPGDSILLSNGKGLCATAQVEHLAKDHAALNIEQLLPMMGESRQHRILALGILDNRERMEFALEKAVELGVSEIYPLLCRFSQRRVLQTSRLEAKAIAALKQCKRSVLPKLHPPMTVEQCCQTIEVEHIILCDAEGNQPAPLSGSVCLMIGPEGGFSPEEQGRILQCSQEGKSVQKWTLAHRRLRAETAAIVALGMLGG